MIATSRIEKTLKFLEREYQSNLSSSDAERPVLFAKMAVLEYCGWLEESFDDIARNCLRGRLRSAADCKPMDDKIRFTHGFKYKEHLHPMLVFGLGLVRVVKIEKQLESDGSLSALKSNLGTLNEMRKEAAHTHTTGRTQRFQAPSSIIANYNQTRPVVLRLWAAVRE